MSQIGQTPRAHISFDETDDWAQARRYDRALDMIAITDGFLNRLWTTLQSMPEYRNSTTLIVTSDHGRGSTLTDWSGHGSKVPGADKIWLAILGPDTPATGEVATHAEQRDITPTIIKLLGLDPGDYNGATGSPIPAAFRHQRGSAPALRACRLAPLACMIWRVQNHSHQWDRRKTIAWP